MVGLKAIDLTHFSLSASSRNSSPHRSAPSAPVVSIPIKSLSPSSSLGSVDTPATTPSATELEHSPLDSTGTKSPSPRRKSIGAVNSLAAALRRSSSFRSASTPSPTLTSSIGAATPVINPTSLAPNPSAASATINVGRPVSDSSLPSRSSHANNVASLAKVAPSLGKQRSKSSAPPNSRAGVGLPQVHSQPAISRGTSSGPGGVRVGPGGVRLSPPGGTHSPLHPVVPGGRPLPNAGLPINTLSESYIGKVDLKLGEAVNKVFLPPTGIHASGDVCMKGKHSPQWLKAREVGELIMLELRSSAHDGYLLKALLRSPVVKCLSYFLTRLSALLVPMEPGTFVPVTGKDLDNSNLPLALRYNLQIVRCAYELKHSLLHPPAGAEETLAAWRGQFHELEARIMNPTILAIKIGVVKICARARVVESTSATSGSLSGGSLMLDAAKASTVGAAAAAASASVAASSRGLSLSKVTSTVVAPAAAGVPGATSTATAPGPAWIRDLTDYLSATQKLLTKLDCGTDADVWLVSVGTCTVWKGLLALSARKLVHDPTYIASAAPAASAITKESTASKLFKVSTRVKSSPSPPESPNLSPVGDEKALPASNVPARTPGTDVAFIRLLGELELFEHRLQVFASAITVPPPRPIPQGGVRQQERCADISQCGLCKTGRKFDQDDDENDDISEDDLPHSAMSEAMQAVSAMIVVVRASGGKWGLKDGLLGLDRHGKVQHQEQHTPIGLTPVALLESDGFAHPGLVEKGKKQVQLNPVCPTLSDAVEELPTLLLLHLIVSRFPQSVPFRLPNETLGIPWSEYAAELRGFADAEEWTVEIAWEMANEVRRCEPLVKDLEGIQKLDLLATAIKRRVGEDLFEK